MEIKSFLLVLLLGFLSGLVLSFLSGLLILIDDLSFGSSLGDLLFLSLLDFSDGFFGKGLLVFRLGLL